MSAANQAVFISYASQDAEAAKRICAALAAAGIEVWLDQDELVGGDAWDAKIRGQIGSCALFMPVISATTQVRLEGYFRREWKQAAARTHDMADEKAFLLPVVIDDTRDAEAKVPAEFKAVQWTRLKDGETPKAFCERVKRLLEGGEEIREAPPSGNRPKQERRGDRRNRDSRLAYLWIVPGLLFGLFPFIRSIFPSSSASASAPAATAPAATAPAATAPVSPARQLADKARAILRSGSLTRAQLDTAVELCDRATQLDSTDAVIWAIAAEAEVLFIHPYGYDRSEERRRRAQDRATRASSLAPDEFEVRLAQAEVYAHAVGTAPLLAEAEKILRELSSLQPKNRDVTIQLAEVIRGQKRFAEAAQLFESIGEYEIAGWSYYEGGLMRPALEQVSRAPRSPTGLLLKAILQYNVDQNLDAAQATIDQLRPSELLAELPAMVAMRIANYRRDSKRMLEIIQGLTATYLDSNAYRGPRALYTGLAYELAQQPIPAEREYRAALVVVEARLKSVPDSHELLLWSAWLKSALHEDAEAERLFARSQAVVGLVGDTGSFTNFLILIRLRKTEPLLAWAGPVLRNKATQWETIHAELRFNPLADFLRADPRFEKLLRETLPEGAKPLEEPVAAPANP